MHVNRCVYKECNDNDDRVLARACLPFPPFVHLGRKLIQS